MRQRTRARHANLAALLWLIFTALAAAPAADPAPVPVPVPVGVARLDITPAYPVRLSGFGFRRTESEGVTQRIWAKAIAVGAKADELVVLIAMDNLGVPHWLCDAVAKAVHEKTGLRREHLAITATHTHTAPMLTRVCPTLFSVPIPPEHQKNIDRYTVELEAKLIEVALAAIADRQLATLAFGIGRAGFAVNRRTSGGPVDHDLPVLTVRASDGKLRAVYTSYACHCVTLSHNRVSGDWAGYVQEHLERLFPGVVALASVGCGADANPSSGVTGDNFARASEQGEEIAREVKRLIDAGLPALDGQIRVRWQLLSLPFDALPTREEWQKRQAGGGPVGYHAQVQLEKLARGEKLLEALDYPVQTWAWGDRLAMVFLPGEVVVDYSLRLKRELDRRRLWINAYSNDAPCYIPSERILKEGGYEGGDAMVYYDKPTRFRPGLEDKIITAVREQLGDAFRAPQDAKGTHGVLPLSPADSKLCFRTHGGLAVELVAAEPQIESPVSIGFTPDGRVLVAEMRDYPLGFHGNYEPGGRIRLLADRDGDGYFEHASVFVDGVPFPTAVTWWRRGALVCAAPDILHAEDGDGDGKADQVRKLVSGFETHNYQARVNSLELGLDGWIHGAGGILGGQVKTASGIEADLRQRDFRFHPDSGAIEPLAGWTQHGRAQDDWGNWFGCDSGSLGRHLPLAEADRYFRRSPHVTPPPASVSLARSDEDAQLYPADPGIVLFALSGPPGRATSACGLTIHRDDLLGVDEEGQAYQGNVFTCEPVHQVVHRLILKRDGTSFHGQRPRSEIGREFLASTDRWFRPVEARTAPDGTLWIVDMYRYVIEHPRWIPPESLEGLDVRAGANRGRIWRVRPQGQPLRQVVRVDRLDAAALVQALETANGTQRDLARHRLLSEPELEVAGGLHDLAKQSSRAETRLAALSVLAGRGELIADDIEHALADSEPAVRKHALRWLEPLQPQVGELTPAALRLLDDPDPQVVLQLAYSLGELKGADVTPSLLRLLAVSDASSPLGAAVLSSFTAEHTLTALKTIAACKTESGSTAGEELAQLFSRLAPLVAAQAGPAEIELALEAILAKLAPRPTMQWLNALVILCESTEERSVDVAKPSLRPPVLARVEAMAASLLDETANPPLVQALAARLLGCGGLFPGQDAQSRLSALLAPSHDQAVQLAAVEALERRAPLGGAEVLLAKWELLSPDLRSRTLDLLCERQTSSAALLAALENHRLAPGLLSSAHRQRLLQARDAAIRGRAERLFAEARASSEELLARRRAVLSKPGQAEAGRAVFVERCASCHRLGDLGHAVGPDLRALTDRSARALLRAIVDPDASVEPRYLAHVAVLRDGRAFSGLLTESTSTAVTLLAAGGVEYKLLRADIEALEASGSSFMARGLDDGLADAQLADLIALLAVPTRPKAVPGNTPRTCVPAAGGALLLEAASAEIHGGDITFEEPFANIGLWHGEEDHVTWSVNCDAARVVDVWLEWACHPESAGNAWILDGAKEPLRGKVASTGGWDRYQLTNAGALELSQGACRLTLRPDGPKSRPALLDLRALHLLPQGVLPPGVPPPAIPAEQYLAIAKEFNGEGHALRQAKSDEERELIVERVSKLTLRLLDLAEKHPRDPAAMDALVQAVTQEIWMENNTSHPGQGQDSPEVQAIASLLRDHVQSDRAAEACRRMSYGFRKECETFLRKVLEINPHRDVRALACLRLAEFLHGRLHRLDLLKEQPKLAKRYEGLFGKDYLEALERQDRAAALKEVETIFEQAAQQYGDVKLPFGGTVGGAATAEIYEIRHLAAGRVAPDLEGDDQDGRHFKLSDYRGKVVLLYFWSEY